MSLIHGQALSAEELERALSRELTPQRFVSLCNAIAWLTAGRALQSAPSFTERVNVRDKGIDAELEIALPGDPSYASPYLGPGVNILQFKQRDIFAQGRAKTVTNLKSELKGALKRLAAHSGSHPDRYVVFTNIDLSRDDKQALKRAIRYGYSRTQETHVEIVGAGELVAAVNGLPHVRSGYFATGRFSSWQEARRRHSEAKLFGGSVSLIGRDQELGLLKTLVDQPDVRAIVLTGPHNIGKSRLALEATAHRFLDVVVALEGRAITPDDLASMITPGRPAIVIVEDPDLGDLDRLVSFVLGTPDLSLVATLAQAEGTPDPNLGRDSRVRVVPVGPLTDTASHELLQAAGARFDFGMEAWVVDQAGGNPGILLAAAKAGPEFRRTTAAFAESITRAFTRRVRSELGETALDALKVLSLMTHVGISGQAGQELTLVSTLFGGALSERTILSLLPRLQESGLLRVTGPFVTVTPPVFANGLAKDHLRARHAELMELFVGLSSSGRDRLLRRLQSLRSEEAERFWARLAGPDGPLSSLPTALRTPRLLRIVATAAPERAVAIIEGGLPVMSLEERKAIHGDQRRELMSALDELIFREETSSRALRSLVHLAEAENEPYGNNAAGVFAEVFQWNHPQLPLPLDERLSILRECTATDAPRERQLIAVKAIDTGLRQRGAVMLRRGGGAVPLDAQPRMTWGEMLDYNEALADELAMLARSADKVVAGAALAALPTALQGPGRPEKLVARIKTIVRWVVDEAVPVPIAKLVGTIRFIRARLIEDARRPGTQNADELRALQAELEGLLTKLESGEWAVRLKRWAGPSAWGDHQEDQQGRRDRDRWDDELSALAREAAEDPTRLTPELRDWLAGPDAQRAYRFFYWLGRNDASRRWLPTLEDSAKGNGGAVLAQYFGGLAVDNPAFVNTRLDQLTSCREVSGRALISATASLRPDEAALRRVATLLGEGRVDPAFTAGVLSGGRWAEPLSDTECLALISAIAGPDLRHSVPVVDFLGMWRHLGRRIDGPLAEFAWRCLETAPKITSNETYDVDQLATALTPTNPDRAFGLLEKLLTTPRARESWRPTDRYGQTDFWNALRRWDRGRALRLVFGVATREPSTRLEIMWDLQELLDQVQDEDILSALAMEKEQQAELVSQALTTAKPGFWPIALRIAERYPRHRRILGNLEAGIEQMTSVIQGPMSAHLERCRAEVRDVLERERLSPKVASWLREGEASLAKRAQSQLIAEATEDVNEIRRVVENPAAPERLWAIRSLVAAKQTAVLRTLIGPEELRQLIPKLRLKGTDRDRLRRELGLPVHPAVKRRKAPSRRRRRPNPR